MGGWSGSGYGWTRSRRRSAEVTGGGSWTVADTATVVVAAMIRWELAVAFVALKLWQQASGHGGSAFAFAREKWEGLVGATRSLVASGAMPSLHVGPRSSGNLAFDRWRRDELGRIEAERDRLRTAEHEFAAYRDELLHAKDRDDFERFMRGRDVGEARAELHRGA